MFRMENVIKCFDRKLHLNVPVFDRDVLARRGNSFSRNGGHDLGIVNSHVFKWRLKRSSSFEKTLGITMFLSLRSKNVLNIIERLSIFIVDQFRITSSLHGPLV